LCGAVAFEIDGELTPIQLCHATRCRKASGAAAAPELLAKTSELSFVRGADLIRVYEAPLLEEPPAYRRAFCGTCGSPLPAEIVGSEYAMLNPGVLDDDPGTREFRHAFVAHNAVWHQLTGTLPSFEGSPPRPKGF
jgi:hypothetical protein